MKILDTVMTPIMNLKAIRMIVNCK
jgi:hypothetical protein